MVPESSIVLHFLPALDPLPTRERQFRAHASGNFMTVTPTHSTKVSFTSVPYGWGGLQEEGEWVRSTCWGVSKKACNGKVVRADFVASVSSHQ